VEAHPFMLIASRALRNISCYGKQNSHKAFSVVAASVKQEYSLIQLHISGV